MNYFERYKQVNTPYGQTLSSHTINATKASAERTFYASPTLTDVEVNGERTQSIVSLSYKDFFDRTFLFPPDSKYAKVGNYIKYRNYTYLVMQSNDNDIYPNLHTKVCNDDFDLPVEITKVKVKGHRGYTYKDEIKHVSVPIVVDMKGYSISDNAILPLTEGRVIIYMRYEPKYLEYIHLNYEFELLQDTYKITDIQLDKVINDEGYIVLSAQKVVENDA